MAAKKIMYEVHSVRNEYYMLGENGGAHGSRPEIVYYCDGPGGPGYYGFLLSPSQYFDTAEEAKRALPLLQQAYDAGYREAKREIRAALGI